MLRDLWSGLDRGHRAGFVAGVLAIVTLAGWLAFTLLRTDYEVLFASLAPHDAAAMTGELDRMKLPYRLGGDGTTILAPRDAVHATRLKLMGRDLPLQGAVGFELFNESDLGMTEFAQKINYQRALQGELTRTILSLREIASARVHLALPEEGLFRREPSRAKASITVALQRGQTLRGPQVAGIQRLVAAAVTGIAPADVTIVDQHGIALTRAGGADGQIDPSGGQELKKEIEQALARKVGALLDRMFGAGHAMASVDVTLDMNQLRVTTEDVRGQGGAPGEAPSGVIVRERESIRDDTAPAGHEAGAGASLRETEYQVGRRVEQVVAQPGSIRTLHVVAVVRDALDGERLAGLKALIGAAVGASAARGDTVVVQVASAPLDPADAVAGDVPLHPTAAGAATAAPAHAAPVAPDLPWWSQSAPLLAAGAGLAAVGVGMGARRRRPRHGDGSSPLSGAGREAALERVRAWLREGRDAVEADARKAAP